MSRDGGKLPKRATHVYLTHKDARVFGNASLLVHIFLAIMLTLEDKVDISRCQQTDLQCD